jgi:hypothetical protein
MTNDNPVPPQATQEPDTSHGESELKLLRDRVDFLQISIAEKKKPWYHQASNIISAIALLFSISSGFYVHFSKHSEDIRSQKEELRKTLALLLDLRENFEKLVGQTVNVQDLENAGIRLNTKRGIYLEAAALLARKIPQHVSATEYNLLAVEVLQDSNFNQAESYFLKGIDASTDLLNRNVALRGIAYFYFLDSPLRDFDKGRTYYQKAVDILKPSPSYNSYMQYALGLTYMYWGIAELGNGFQTEGNLQIDRANKFFSDIPLNNPLRSHAQQLLIVNKKMLTEGNAPSAESILYGKPSKD